MTQAFQDALKNSSFSSILKQAKQHLALDQLLKKMLPPDLHAYFHVAQLDGDILIIHVQNSVWLTKFNYTKPNLMQKIKTHSQLRKIKDIHFKVRPFQNH